MLLLEDHRLDDELLVMGTEEKRARFSGTLPGHENLVPIQLYA